MDRSIPLLSRHTLAMSTTRSQRRGQNYDRKRTRRARSWLTTTTAAFALSGITGASARDIVYCSDVNTGSDSSPNTSTYQSNGLCYDTCNAGSYAFAILQGQDCWCSNYVPATDASGCNDPCPGYPSDTCGNMQKNLYGYMALPNKPSGTKGADTTVSTTSPHPITSTVTAKGPTETMIIVSTKTPTKAQTTSSPTTSPTQKSTATQDQIVVTTVAGGFKTIIISASGSTKVPSATALPSANNSDFFSNAGRVAGLIIGLILVLFFIVAGVLFYRRRQAMRRSELYAPGSTGGVIPAGGAGFFGSGKRGRSMSTLGLVGEKTPPASSTPPLGANGAAVAAPQTAGGTTPQVGEVYDQRLDPGSLFMRFDHRTGSSRVSVRSLRDDQDYSRRVLRLANPDD